MEQSNAELSSLLSAYLTTHNLRGFVNGVGQMHDHDHARLIASILLTGLNGGDCQREVLTQLITSLALWGVVPDAALVAAVDYVLLQQQFGDALSCILCDLIMNDALEESHLRDLVAAPSSPTSEWRRGVLASALTALHSPIPTPVAQLRSMLRGLVSTFFDGGYMGSLDVFKQRLESIAARHVHTEIVRKVLQRCIDDAGLETLEAGSHLLSSLHSDGLLMQDELWEGFLRTLKTLQSLALDSPRAPQLCACFIARAVRDGIIDASMLEDAALPPWITGQASAVAAEAPGTLRVIQRSRLLLSEPSPPSASAIWGLAGPSLEQRTALLSAARSASSSAAQRVQFLLLHGGNSAPRILFAASVWAISIEQRSLGIASDAAEALGTLCAAYGMHSDAVFHGCRRIFSDIENELDEQGVDADSALYSSAAASCAEFLESLSRRALLGRLDVRLLLRQEQRRCRGDIDGDAAGATEMADDDEGIAVDTGSVNSNTAAENDLAPRPRAGHSGVARGRGGSLQSLGGLVGVRTAAESAVPASASASAVPVSKAIRRASDSAINNSSRPGVQSGGTGGSSGACDPLTRRNTIVSGSVSSTLLGSVGDECSEEDCDDAQFLLAVRSALAVVRARAPP